MASQEESDAIPAFLINDNIVSKSGHNIKDIKTSLGSGVAEPAIKAVDCTIKYMSGKKTATVSNVVGIIEGSDKKEEYLFVTAHYDHIGIEPDGRINYGADDDGSGTVAVIEMAEAFAKAKKKEKGRVEQLFS
ncbi:M28 family peptidase [Niabella ginsengisoli]|uniref:M28 family peptidase n=1 Tax=Niabella ginsengisoli TaxID=522298 RepID=A0ABS9SNI7_9BACT|nr:M28 family peptidase [Niabella ginsengisoli]MCH5599915.1 M28 family peptidase [Niabella ginsengisoli]